MYMHIRNTSCAFQHSLELDPSNFELTAEQPNHWTSTPHAVKLSTKVSGGQKDTNHNQTSIEYNLQQFNSYNVVQLNGRGKSKAHPFSHPLSLSPETHLRVLIKASRPGLQRLKRRQKRTVACTD